jgi:hypothetical protein
METIQEALTAIAERNGGQLTPDVVVRAAKAKTSPLHSHFTWDDSEAARAYRLVQASFLIRKVKVRIEVEPEKTLSVRAWMNVSPGEVEGKEDQPEAARVYVPVRVAMEQYREQVIAQAVSELKGTQRKYAHLKELSNVWGEIEKL